MYRVCMCGTFRTLPGGRVVRQELLRDEAPTQADPAGANWPVLQEILFPGGWAPVMLTGAHNRQKIKVARWGLLPAWAKNITHARLTYNARAETMERLPSFRDAVRSHRALVPAVCWWEWPPGSPGRRVRHRIEPHEDYGPLAMAGLWSEWTALDGTIWTTFSVITVPSEPHLSHVHHRRPALIEHTSREEWLNPATSPERVLELPWAPAPPLWVVPDPDRELSSQLALNLS